MNKISPEIALFIKQYPSQNFYGQKDAPFHLFNNRTIGVMSATEVEPQLKLSFLPINSSKLGSQDSCRII